MQLDVKGRKERIVKIDFLDVWRRAILDDRRQKAGRGMGQLNRRAAVTT